MKTYDWKQAALCMKLLAHPSRLQMIALLEKKHLSVGELAEACGILPHVASEHLNLLKLKGLIDCEKKDRKVFYYVVDSALFSILRCIEKRFEVKT